MGEIDSIFTSREYPFDELFFEPDPPLCPLEPVEDPIMLFDSAEEKSNDDSYTVYKLGRQLAPAVNIPLSYLSAKGQYRVNYSIYVENPDHGAFKGWGGAFYVNETLPGKASQQVFLTDEYQGKKLSEAEIQKLRQSGAGMQSVAGYGVQAQLVLRLSADIYALSERDYADMPGEEKFETVAIAVDTAAVGVNLADASLYNRGLLSVSQGSEIAASRWLMLSHRTNIVGNVLLGGSGALRLTHEFYDYCETGEINQSTVVFASMDMAIGATGVAYSSVLLSEAGGVTSMASQNNALMHVVQLSPRMQWGLRVAGVAGAAFGFGVNAYTYHEASSNPFLSDEEKNEIKTVSIFGMIGSGLMVSGGLMVTVASAPIAGGVLLTVGIAFLVGQSVYQYRAEIKALASR